jgi:OOP family OmpA-OmpF porin
LVRADTVEVGGVTGSQGARARIAQILSEKLGQGQSYKVNVTYVEALDPVASVPTPDECLADLNGVLARQKVVFPPGLAEIDGSANKVMEALAKVLERCGGVRMEIGGHTDAQGSEEGNRTLSQTRAEAVLLALQGRQVDVSALTAVGYGDRPKPPVRMPLRRWGKVRISQVTPALPLRRKTKPDVPSAAPMPTNSATA